MNHNLHTTPQAIDILKQYFGYDQFRLGQEEIINAILDDRDALAIMPTGAGKSLCFQVPALLMDGITLVISPLISLMRDQVDALTQTGISAAYINSSLSVSQTYKALSNAQNGAYKIIYVAPERLEAPSFLEFAQNTNISMIAVDEAHCVSHWGQDFRPSYLHISSFVDNLPKRPIVTAFTATATDLVKEDITRLLGLDRPFIRSTGFNRENLYFEVRHPSDKFAELAEYLRNRGGKSGIIYCATRKAVDEIASKLKNIGIKAARYHAGMGQEERTAAQHDFIYDYAPVIVATNAFGMGIDKSNVSFVVHYNMPKNMESYYQEAGRAGRDGSPAECLLLFSRQDIIINQFLIEKSEQNEDYENGTLDTANFEAAKARDYRRLREMEAYCNTTDCLRQYILDYFQDDGNYTCDYCSNCGTEREMIDVTIEAQKILSCVYRMKGRFGLVMVIGVLRGEQNQKIKNARLDSLKTYGIMKDQSPEEIRRITQYLIQRGYIQVLGDRYPVVQTTEKASHVLRDGAIVKMPAPDKEIESADFVPDGISKGSRAPKAPKSERVIKTAKGSYAVDESLFANLKTLRLQLAAKEGVPAFVIFSDAALYDMCTKLPTDDKGFLSVSGVGEVKLKKYGSVFLEAIREYLGSGTEINPRKEPTDRQSGYQLLFNEFQLFDEPVHISGYMEQANILLMKIRGRGTSASNITKKLEEDGYLEMRETEDGRRSRLPTQKGIDLGIESHKEESPDGRVFLRNYYGIRAQELMLGYIRELAGI